MDIAQLMKGTTGIWSKLYNASDNDLPATSIGFVGIPNMRNDFYHFNILIVSNDQSVILDCLPTMGGDPEPATLLVKSNPTTHIPEAEGQELLLDIPCTSGATVSSILNKIMADGRHRYIFDSESRGCRHWCATIIKDLEETGVVATGETQRVYDFVAAQSEGQPTRIPAVWYKGRFFQWYFHFYHHLLSCLTMLIIQTT